MAHLEERKAITEEGLDKLYVAFTRWEKEINHDYGDSLLAEMPSDTVRAGTALLTQIAQQKDVLEIIILGIEFAQGKTP